MSTEPPHIPLSEYRVTYSSLMYPGPSLHRLQPTDPDGAEDTRSQYGSQAEADWLCGHCSVLVCDEHGQRRTARAFRPPAKTPFWWLWCDKCRAAINVGTASKKELNAVKKAMDIDAENKKMQTFFSLEATKDW